LLFNHKNGFDSHSGLWGVNTTLSEDLISTSGDGGRMKTTVERRGAGEGGGLERNVATLIIYLVAITILVCVMVTLS